MRFHSPTSSLKSIAARFAAGALLLLGALPVFSQSSSVYDFSLPSASLSDSLEKFSSATGLDVAARAEGLKGKSAPAITGKLTAEQALKRLLAGSGLSHRFTSPGAVAILEPQAEGDTDGGETLAPVVVTAEAPSYTVTNATTATKLDTPLRDIPQAINVIPRQVLEDRGIVRVAEIADNVPGVVSSPGYGGLSSGGFFIRGFDYSSIYHDGFKDFGFLSPVDVNSIERVEFLKGPASVLYGQNQPGGIVNYVSKRPIANHLAQVDAAYGSFDFYRATADFGGTLLSRTVPGTPTPASEKNPKAPVLPVEEPILMFRLNGTYENAGSYRDYNESESYYVSPSLTWNIGPDTSLTVFGDYQSYDYVFDRGLLPVRQTFQVPISRFLGEPENFAETDFWRAGYEFLHKFGNDWQFRSAFAAIQSEQHSLFAQPGELGADGRTVFRTNTRRFEKSENYTLQNELSGKFNTGSIEHHVLLGVELSRYEFGYDLAFGKETTIDIFHPVYGATLENIPSAPWESYGTDALGIYVQDQVTITSQLKLLAGLRYDYAESYYDYFPDEQTDKALTPRVGIVYQPWEPVSFFFGWSRSFNPNVFYISANGEAFDPEEGEQFEAGVKLDLIPNRLTSTIAVYDITKQNVATADPSNPDFSILTGEQKSRGAEFDLIGNISPGWNVVLSYAYTDAYISKDTTIPEGSALAAVPKNQAGLWTSYEIQDGKFKGFGVGAGVFYMDDRPATLPGNGVELPDFVRVDASIFYRRDNWSAQVNFKNITDEKIYQSQGYLITPDAPFNVQASITYRF
jgi:iron complex outermembrane receptor protein